jgi:hypothetical protein
MRDRAIAAIVLLVLTSLCVTAIAADIAMPMSVAPNVLVLSAPTNWITIHTHMLLSSVDQSTLAVAVNGNPVPIAIVKADSCGLMVLKIRQTEVDAYVAPGTATFVVTGSTTDLLTFEGSDTIRVKG